MSNTISSSTQLFIFYEQRLICFTTTVSIRPNSRINARLVFFTQQTNTGSVGCSAYALYTRPLQEQFQTRANACRDSQMLDFCEQNVLCFITSIHLELKTRTDLRWNCGLLNTTRSVDYAHSLSTLSSSFP